MKKSSKIILSCIILLCLIAIYVASKHTTTTSDLQSSIEAIIKDKKATIGVAVITETEDILIVNDSVLFPMMSVFKFHLALAILDHMDKNNIPLDTLIDVKNSELLPNTYSPLRDANPNDDLIISMAELLQYSVSQSDNNACDILFRYIGGTSVVENYIKSLGITDISIKANEEKMHEQFENNYLNHTTPSSMVKLLRIAETTTLLSPIYKDFLLKIMIETSTGANKIKGQLPDSIIIGHKTGSSDRDSLGMKTGDNDAAFIYLPDGRKYYIAVFIKDSYESDDTNASTIAAISKVIIDSMY